MHNDLAGPQTRFFMACQTTCVLALLSSSFSPFPAVHAMTSSCRAGAAFRLAAISFHERHYTVVLVSLCAFGSLGAIRSIEMTCQEGRHPSSGTCRPVTTGRSLADLGTETLYLPVRARNSASRNTYTEEGVLLHIACC